MSTFINTPNGPTPLAAGIGHTGTVSSATPASGAPQPTTQNVGGLNTLHYGGSISMKTARLGAKPKAGSIYRNQARMETMIRLENAGMAEAAIATMMCISVPRLRTIKKSPDYLIARMQITHGIIVDNASKIAQVKEQRKEILTQMLPPALLALANELQMPAHTLMERRHKVAVAQDLLDREGTFAKVSRTEIKPVDAFDFEHVDERSRGILNAIRNVAPAPLAACKLNSGADAMEAEFGVSETHSIDAVEANEEFSNSHTMSQTDQELALAKLEEEAEKLAKSGIALANMPLPTQEIQ